MSRTIVHLSVAEAYDRWAGLYDTYDNPILFVAGHAVATLSGSVVGKQVFEFGCGTGRNLAALKAFGAAGLAGCDLSDGMLAEARRRDRAFDVTCQDMSRPVAHPDGTADIVLFCLSLEHVPDLLPPLREARRLLRPGGEIMIVEIHPALSAQGVAAHFSVDGCEMRMPTFPHSLKDYARAFDALGLSVTRRRDWRPAELTGPVPPKVLKHGRHTPLVLQVTVRGPGAG